MMFPASAYAKTWIALVDKFGGKHHGYLVPHEGACDIAIVQFSFDSLADYETYRKDSMNDADCWRRLTFRSYNNFYLLIHDKMLQMMFMAKPDTLLISDGMSSLQQLEAQSIHILRETFIGSARPVMLFSAGKDSAVMLHLARKAFYPSKLPFPLLHIDTGWKFKEMIDYRDRTAQKFGLDLLVFQNLEGAAQGVSPFTHGASQYTDIMKTQALKSALDKYGFDAALAGARRDEEKSRAKERVFSRRTAGHNWDPKRQRPELWNIYNTHIMDGESLRVFPLSNWTEMDIWLYIEQEKIEVPNLYFAAKRPVTERSGALILIDDERMGAEHSNNAVEKTVRFRSLGCYPLTGAVESEACSVSAIIEEMRSSTLSERSTRPH